MATPFRQHITGRFRPAQALFEGKATAQLVPDVFPVAINGRAYQLDRASRAFARQFDPRVRDSVDQSTAPGEAAINPQGLWRRGEVSWHYGAGQKYADTAEAQDYRFYTSKGVNPWVKGQLTLLNKTAKNTGTSAPTTNVGKVLVVNDKIFVIDGTDVKYASSLSGNWTTTTAPAGVTAVKDLASDGTNVFACYTATTSGVYSTPVASPGTWTRMVHEDLDKIGYVNGRLMGADGHILYDASVRAYSSGSIGSGDTLLTHRNTAFTWVDFAGGNTHIYAAGYAGDVSLIYKTTIKTDGSSLDAPSVAAQLPLGEIVSSIDSYLGFVFIGSNKGVRFASADGNGNLTIGSLIFTSGEVKGFTFEDRFAWFCWTNYDGTSGGLGRLDISTFTATNTPAFATDLMYDSTAAVLSVATFAGKRLFTMSGVGVIYEDTGNLVNSGELVSGIYRWGIPDRKFVARVDTRSTPLVGYITPSISLDNGAYTELLGQQIQGTVESVSTAPQDKFIECKFKFQLERFSALTGPTMTRWMARAYATPARSQLFRVPLLMHSVLRVKGTDYFFNVQDELAQLRNLVTNPRIVNYQENSDVYSVIVEDVEFQATDALGSSNETEGTAIVTMRSVQD